MPRLMVHAMCDTYVAFNIGQVTPKLGQDFFLSDVVLRLGVNLAHMAPIRFSSIIPNLLQAY
jgi:hypothetical protein